VNVSEATSRNGIVIRDGAPPSPGNGGVVGAEDVTEDECSQLGGFVYPFNGFWLLHVWAIPGREAPEGIFSHKNSLLT
jgi:hypothetical protein